MREPKQLNQTVEKVCSKANPKLTPRIPRTMHQTRTIHSTQVMEEVVEVFGAKVYSSIIKRTIKLADSSVVGEPVLTQDRNSEAANACRELAKEVIKRG